MSHRVVHLVVENLKRIEAIDVTPDPHTVIVSGPNGAGKSTLLDSLLMAMGGGSQIPEHPIRTGADEALIEVDLGELVVTRTFTQSGTRLVVKAKDGRQYASPQTMLDQMVGKMTFDPLTFMRMRPAEQAKVLSKLCGVDFSDLDTRRSRAFDERTMVNRGIKALEGALAMMPKQDAPAKEVSISDLVSQLKKIDAAVSAHRDLERAAESKDDQARRSLEATNAIADHIDALRRQLAEREAAYKESLEATSKLVRETAEAKAEAQRVYATTPTMTDRQAVERQIRDAEGINATVRNNAKRQAVADDIAAKQKTAADLTNELESIERERENRLSQARIPVKGLAFTDQSVLFNGLPVEQASSAEQIRISVAVGISMNPTIRVLMIRDGSLLDDRSMKIISDMAQKHSMQIWIERVANPGDGVGIVIVDGKQSTAAQQPPKA